MGKRFGLGPDGGWSMLVPIVESIDEIMKEDEEPEAMMGGRNQIGAAYGIHVSWNGTTE